MNEKDKITLETKIKKYVEKCFKDAFKSEKRIYNEDLWYFEFVIIKKQKFKIPIVSNNLV